MARQAALPTTADITAHSTALIALDSDIKGSVSFGPGCIVHPKAVIHAVSGNIAFGKDCVVEEGARVIYDGGGTMRIGEGNMFMIGSRVESPSIGHYNTFQPRSLCSSMVEITDHCTISAATSLEPALDLNAILDGDADVDIPPRPEVLEPYTVIYGAGSLRRIADGKNQEGEDNLRTKHLEYLREILPKYNRMRPV